MELSTRDRVALAAYTEIKQGRGTPNGGVWLDVPHLPKDTIMSRLPRVYQTLLELQLLDITEEAIEIAPTAHYSMGGVWVRPEDHSTGIEGLYAIGEASSGLHGANRLGGNSLIELLGFGRIVGAAAADYSARLLAQQRSAAAVTEARAEIDELLARRGPENVRPASPTSACILTSPATTISRTPSTSGPPYSRPEPLSKRRSNDARPVAATIAPITRISTIPAEIASVMGETSTWDKLLE